MLISQISVFLENKPGRLTSLAKVLGENGVDIRALSLADTTNFGILRLIVNRPEEAERALKEAGFTVNTTKVIAVGIEDTPGGLYRTLLPLDEAGISVEYTYAFITRKADGAFLILRVEDHEKAVDQLRRNGVRVLTAEEVYSI